MAPAATISESERTSDGRVYKRMENYAKFWNEDLKKEEAEHTKNRLSQYMDVINGYYDGATGLYEYAWGQSFHFSRFYKGESFYQSLARHEHYLAFKMGLKPGMRVLDVGCGIGGPARQIAAFSDVHITGVTINEFQIGRARMHTKRVGLEERVQFRQGDFMKLSEYFAENSFDAVYAIEATVHSPSWEGVYGEIMKVLKPGGVFGVYEWCMTDNWDPKNPEHKEVAHGIEVGTGVPQMRTTKEARQAMINVGFQIEHEEDLAERDDAVPWYYPLEGDLSKAQTMWDLMTVWRNTWSGKVVTHWGLWFLEKAHIVPRGTWEVGETMKVAALALVKGGQDHTFTPMFLMIARKPAQK